MNKNALFLLAAVAAVLMMKQKAAAASAPAAAASPVATSVNNQMWNSILGNTWQGLVSGATGFLMRNDQGQVVTSDGKPVTSVLPAISSALTNGGYEDVDTAAPDGTDWLANMGW
jgi:hypothetical protein